MIKRQKTSLASITSVFFWKQYWQPALLLLVLPVTLYIQTLGFEYVLDDQIVLTQNEFTQKGLAGISDILTNESFVGRFGEQKDLVTGARYRPLSIVTFAVEYEFFGANPFVSHLVNIILYGLLCLLIFRVFALLFPLRKQRWWWNLAFITTLVFAVHPVHSEVVANVKGRDEIMALLGAMGALYCSIRYLQRGSWHWLLWSGAAFFLGVMSKENALTFLAIIPLTLYFFTKSNTRRILLTVVPVLVASIAYLVIRYQVIGYFLSSDGAPVTDIMNNPFYGLSTPEKYATIFYTLGKYLQLLVFPHPLTHDYYPYQIPVLDWSSVGAILSLVANILLAGLAVWGFRRKAIWSYGILFYFLTLSIVSNLPFTVGTFMNERFLFMPSLGFCLILAWSGIKKLADWNPLAGKIMIGIFVAGFMIKSLDRIPDWKNRMTLNVSGATASPNSARANCFLGTAIFEEEYRKTEIRTEKQALIKEVAYFIDRALEIHPNYGSALIMQSGVVAEEYKFDRDLPKLLGEFRQIMYRKDNIPFIDTYVEYLCKGRGDRQQMADFCLEIGYNYFVTQKKNYPRAIQYLNYGLTAMPNNRSLLQAMGNVYQLTGDNATAQEYFSRM